MEKVTGLYEYTKPKHNVHKEIKVYASSIKGLLEKIMDLDDSVQSPVESRVESPLRHPERAVATTQTSPDSRVNAARKISKKKKKSKENKENNEKRVERGRRDNGSPIDVPRTPETETLDGEEPSQTEWQEVRKKKPRLRKQRPLRPDVVIVKAKEGGPSYADMLKKLKDDPSLKEVGESVAKIRRNGAGNLLLELRKSAPTIRVSDAISQKLGESANVVTQTDETTVEIRDLDESTTPADVREALSELLGIEIQTSAVKSVRKAYRCTQTAIVRLSTELARKSVDIGRVRIGWVNCRIRERIDVRKCFKCWAFGHMAKDCKGTDRSKCCLRCSEEGHMRKACKNKEARCVLCSERRNHPTGSFACPAYQEVIRAVIAKK